MGGTDIGEEVAAEATIPVVESGTEEQEVGGIEALMAELSPPTALAALDTDL